MEWISVLLGFLLSVIALFLIMLVLVQRGRGGGLTGALGGMGGQSAFGSKAGDVFTRVTIVTAAIWIVLCVASVKLLSGRSGDRLNLGGAGESTEPGFSAPVAPKQDARPGSTTGDPDTDLTDALGVPAADSEPSSEDASPGSE